MMRGDAHGFTLLELTIAMGIALTVVATLAQLLPLGERAFVFEPEMADMEQRLRVFSTTLTSDILEAIEVVPGPTADRLTIMKEGLRREYRLDGQVLRRSEDGGPDWPVLDGVGMLEFEVVGPAPRVRVHVQVRGSSPGLARRLPAREARFEVTPRAAS